MIENLIQLKESLALRAVLLGDVVTARRIQALSTTDVAALILSATRPPNKRRPKFKWMIGGQR